MNDGDRRLTLVPNTREQVLAEIERMAAEQRSELSSAWLEQLHSPTVDQWTLGFAMLDHTIDVVVGGCGFKGPPGPDAVVEIAYSVAPVHEGKGYATEAAAALVAYAFSSGRVRLVRAHTLPTPNASGRVLTKCGFRRVGEVIDPDDGLVWRWERSPDASVP